MIFSRSSVKNVRNQGFTLLEMMVVLVIVSLISVLLMQGCSFATGLQERIRAQLVKVENLELKEQWFRVVTRSLIREDNMEDGVFEGDLEHFSGTTLQPLRNGVGLPTKIAWRLVYEGDRTLLQYSEGNDDPVTMLVLPNQRQSFKYLATDGVFHDVWPPEDDASVPGFSRRRNSNSSPLPRGIVMMPENSDSDMFWYVSISDKTQPLPDFAL